MANIKISNVQRRNIDNPSYLNMFISVDDNKNKQTTRKPTVYKRSIQKNKYYFTKNSQKQCTNIFKEDDVHENPFKLPQISQKYDDIFQTKRGMKQKYKDGHTHNSRFGNNMRTRLKVPVSPTKVITVNDIDPDFFSLVEGRPIKYPFNKDKFITDIRDTMLYRLETGYQQDGLLQIEKKIKTENAQFVNACENHNSCVADFEIFLHDDYESATNLLNKAKQAKDISDNKNEEYRELNSTLEKVKRIVYVLEDKCRQTKIYKDFLYTVSPLSWCKENSVKLRGSFDKYDIVKESGSVMSLDSLIWAFQRDFSLESHTNLYFSSPEQLVKMLDDIVMQNLNSWSNAEKLTVNVQKLDLATGLIKSRIKQEYKETDEQIADLETAIKDEETKVVSLKTKATDIINRNFHDTVASFETLKLHMCVRDVFESVLFPGADLQTFTMMAMIEEEYENRMRELDKEDLETVEKARREIFLHGNKLMRSAKMAADKLQALNKINNKLKIALRPPKKWSEEC